MSFRKVENATRPVSDLMTHDVVLKRNVDARKGRD